MCKREIKPRIKRCPYCGTVNPTVKIKEIFLWIIIITLVMAIVTSFMPQ